MVQAAITRGRAARDGGGFQQHKLAPYAFISPFYVLFGCFFLAPSLIALVLSMFRWDGINDPRFVLARNYGRLLSDKVFAQVATNTAIYAISSLLIVLPLALVLAVLLNAKSLRFSNVWRAMYFTPVVTSTVAITLVFQILYSRDTGLLNAPLIYLGLEPIYWLGDRSWAKVAIIILITWRSTGLLTIYFSGGAAKHSRRIIRSGVDRWREHATKVLQHYHPHAAADHLVRQYYRLAELNPNFRRAANPDARRTGEFHHERGAVSL